MPSISTDTRVIFWIIAAVAGAVFAIFGNELTRSIVFFFSRRGRPPMPRPFHIWIIFFISLAMSIFFGALAAFAPSVSSSGQLQEQEYVGRVIDKNSLQPIAGAKISLDLEGVPPIVYTDSEGVYRFHVTIMSSLSGQIRVDAAGYRVYTRNITINPEIRNIEDIRLDLLP